MKFVKNMFLFFAIFLFQSATQNIFCMYNSRGTTFMLVGTPFSGKATILNRIKRIQDSSSNDLLSSKLCIVDPDLIEDSKQSTLENDIIKLSPSANPKTFHSQFSNEKIDPNKLDPEHNLIIEKAKDLANDGVNVIFGTVLLNRNKNEDIYEEVRAEFKGYTLCTILVYCPIKILCSNIAAKHGTTQLRKSSKDYKNAYLTLKQFPMIYKTATNQTNPNNIVGTITYEQVLELCKLVAPKDEIASWLNLFEQHFGLNEKNSVITITPIHTYDLIFKNETVTQKTNQNLNITNIISAILEKSKKD
jgi:hypothetical protein